MSFNLLAISVGNTRTQVGLFEHGELTASDVIAHHAPGHELTALLAKAYNTIKSNTNAQIMVASVNAKAKKQVLAIVRETLGVTEPLLLEEDLDIPIGRQLDPETIVGEDRLLNAAAAFDTLKQACVVVDAGTAITVDYVDGQGTFHGGAIGPGAQMMLDSLQQHTDQLPAIDFEPPTEAIGHNTVQAMRSAVFHGLRGMVRELTEQYAEQVGVYPAVVATGGNAQVLFDEYDLVERIVPDLTLVGMGLTLKKHLESDD